MPPVAYPLSPDEAAYFLSLFRRARYQVLDDAEDFRSVCFALEELGCRLKGKNLRSLSKYKEVLTRIICTKSKNEFSVFFEMVKIARNEASHRGVFARNLASKSLKICIFIEKELLEMTTSVRHLMSENVIFIEPFFRLSKVREIMLENSFSYLPIILNGQYYFISDFNIAKIWHENKNSDAIRYNTEIKSCVSESDLLSADELLSNDKIDEAFKKIRDRPALVFNGTHKNRSLVGILAPFDLL
ncbi:CBS domain-containing protein [Deinococcus marmoris]|uniref:CBS domain-containing protein n=1 Tax=Deinococcus marmoris TaxID=249408 RepID=UPI0011151E15|nr:CBS domain-containing protein [Deinococcus marmoris]